MSRVYERRDQSGTGYLEKKEQDVWNLTSRKLTSILPSISSVPSFVDCKRKGTMINIHIPEIFLFFKTEFVLTLTIGLFGTKGCPQANVVVCRYKSDLFYTILLIFAI